MTERRSAEEVLAENDLPSEGGQNDDISQEKAKRDQVEESGLESFPASDSPAWGGDDLIPQERNPQRR